MTEEQVKQLAATAFELIYYAGLITHEDDITKMNFDDAMSTLEKKKEEVRLKRIKEIHELIQGLGLGVGGKVK